MDWSLSEMTAMAVNLGGEVLCLEIQLFEVAIGHFNVAELIAQETADVLGEIWLVDVFAIIAHGGLLTSHTLFQNIGLVALGKFAAQTDPHLVKFAGHGRTLVWLFTEAADVALNVLTETDALLGVFFKKLGQAEVLHMLGCGLVALLGIVSAGQEILEDVDRGFFDGICAHATFIAIFIPLRGQG